MSSTCSSPVPDSGPFPARTARVFMLGATGTIGLATARCLAERGHRVVCMIRGAPSTAPTNPAVRALGGLRGVEVRFGNPLDARSLQEDGLRGESFDVWVSCMASRTGDPVDAWAVDHAGHVQALGQCRQAGVGHVVLLSAICVQRPLLAFQQAKLAFEAELIASGLNYSIVRPTAFFKSLSGQIGRLRRGRPYLVFGRGDLTACKPISDEDLGDYLAGCLDDSSRHRRILPIGGPGPALTPRQQGLLMFEALGIRPRFREVPLALLDMGVTLLETVGAVWPAAMAKAELGRIGRYYASESMLVLDPDTGRYSEQATPSHGHRTLAEHFRALAREGTEDNRGAHAVF